MIKFYYAFNTRRYYDILDILCCRCQYLRRGGGIRNHPSQGPMSPRQSRKAEIQPDEPHPPILRNTSWAQLGFACASTTSCPRSVCWMCLTMATRAHSGSWSSVLRTGVVTTSWAKQGFACAGAIMQRLLSETLALRMTVLDAGLEYFWIDDCFLHGKLSP